MYKEVVTQLAKFAVETQYVDVPRSVVEFAKCLTLKTIAGIVAGSATPSGQKMAMLIRDRNLPEEAGVIGCGFKTSLWDAIFLQAFLSHASELEDDRFNGGVSWDITVIPLMISLAEKLRLSGKALIEALVVGLEVHARTCLSGTHHLGVTVFPGAVGPAVAAGRALSLGIKDMASAFGLSMSGVPVSITNFGTDAHYFESALHSLQGIMAAEMANKGMTSNPDIVGYLSNLLGKEKVAPKKMLEDLGKRWLFCDMWIKKYPCCFSNHRQIDILIELMKEHSLSYDHIEIIEVHMSPGDEFLNRPEPKTEGDLQFSIQHTLGVTMLYGDVGLGNMTNDKIRSPRFREARSKVKFILHPDWPSDVMAAPARVIIKTKDGRKLSGERMYPIGSQIEPLTTEQFRELYFKFTQGILSRKQITNTLEVILNLENLSTTEELMEMLTFARKI